MASGLIDPELRDEKFWEMSQKLEFGYRDAFAPVDVFLFCKCRSYDKRPFGHIVRDSPLSLLTSFPSLRGKLNQDPAGVREAKNKTKQNETKTLTTVFWVTPFLERERDRSSPGHFSETPFKRTEVWSDSY